ncbi:MAG: glycosyltransferase [Candidatus Dormibacteraeota bacterium]|nr:glycosyltransferase [Candidatus Dormibacteraeota bacterium]
MIDPRPVAVITAHACPFSEIGGAENGGMSIYVREVTARLAKRGVPAVIFTRKEDSGALAHVDLPDSCHLVHVAAGPEAPISKNALFYHMPDFYRGVAAWARDNEMNFRLVHSHYWISGWAGRRLSGLWGVPWLHMAHTLARVKDRDRPVGAVQEPDQRVAVELENVRSCNRLVAPTQVEVEDLAYLYGAERDCISVVPPGVDTDVFREVDPGDLRARIGIHPDEKVILFTGRLERLKGVDTLVHALADILARRSATDVRLLVLGEDSGNGLAEAAAYGGERGRLTALAEELGVADQVTFAGKVPHHLLPRYYSLADVTALPSHSESFGLVAIESQACRTPVVASRVGGLRQLVIDGISGITIAGHDAAVYADALTRIIDDPELARSMGDAGRTVAEAYSWEATADRLLGVYEDTEAYYQRAATALLG